jgi:hypothetical protein
LSNKPEFLDRYIKAGELERLKTLKKIYTSNNPDFNVLKEATTDESVNRIEKEIAQLKETDLKIKHLADEARLLYWHESVYTLLSDAVHNTPKLLEKYLAVDQQGDIKSLLWGPDTKNNFKLLILTAGEILIYALDSMNILLSLNLETGLKKHYDLLGNLLELRDNE